MASESSRNLLAAGTADSDDDSGSGSDEASDQDAGCCTALTNKAIQKMHSAHFVDKQGADPSVVPPTEKVNLGKLIHSIASVAHTFFTDKESRCRAWSFALGLVLMTFVIAAVHLGFINLFRKLQNCLHLKAEEKYWDVLKQIVGLALCMMPVAGLNTLLEGSMALEWRRYLTNKLLRMYIGEHQAYYRLKLQGCDIDNPDQRIVEDCGAFTMTLIKFITTILMATVTIATQSPILWGISSQLFWFVLGYCLFMNVITFVVFGSRLTSANRTSLAQAASFRFGLVRVREHAEAVAFYQGYKFEQVRCSNFFLDLMHTLYYKLGLMVCFEALNKAMGLLLTVMPVAIIASKYFSGHLDFGALMQATTILKHVEGSFNTLVAQLENITAMGAQAMRIKQVWGVLEEMQVSAGEAPKKKKSSFWRRTKPGTLPDVRGVSITDLPMQEKLDESPQALVLKITDVTLQPLVGAVPLVRDLGLTLRSNESLLVKGPSGIGKSFLLRAIGGLWSSGQGAIVRVNAANAFFVPQEPYLCLGSLRDNATYPGKTPAEEGPLGNDDAGDSDAESRSKNKKSKKKRSGSEVAAADDSDRPSDQAIKDALSAVGLGYLAQRFDLDDIVQLDSVLSGGERQRLGIVRMLLRPKPLALVVLDEATSALDEANERRVYDLVKARVKCFVSVAHRTGVHRYHTHQLQLERTESGDCAWTFSTLQME